jgi:hypothetical protein
MIINRIAGSFQSFFNSRSFQPFSLNQGDYLRENFDSRKQPNPPLPNNKLFRVTPKCLTSDGKYINALIYNKLKTVNNKNGFDGFDGNFINI